MKRGDVQRAIGLARQALDSGLSHPVLFNLRAYEHEREGRFVEACADLESARKITPRDPLILNALGRCLTGAGRYYDSIAACGAALAEPSFAWPLNSACHEQLGELARRSPIATLDRSDDHRALARLADLAARGQHAERAPWPTRVQIPACDRPVCAHCERPAEIRRRRHRARGDRGALTTAQARANARCCGVRSTDRPLQRSVRVL